MEYSTYDFDDLEPKFSPSELNDDWLEISGILPNPSVVLDIINTTEIVSPESFTDVINLLIPVALALRYIDLDIKGESTIRDEALNYLEKLMVESATSEYTTWCVGVGMSFFENVKAEDIRFFDAAQNILLDDRFEGTEEERMDLASIIAGESDKALPKGFVKDFAPLTSIEKLESSRKLVMESDVEGYLLNFARNLALVEDNNVDENIRLRAVINLEEILIPTLRMFGPKFDNITERARQSAWEYMEIQYPEFTSDITAIQTLAASIIDPIEQLLNSWIDEPSFRIERKRIKGLGSTILKGLRKGITNYDEIADIIGYRIVVKDNESLGVVINDIISAFKYKNGTYRIITDEFVVELGRQNNNHEENTEDSAAIVLNIQKANELYDKLGRPEKMLAGKPKESGFETVYLNFVIKKLGISTRVGTEIQIVTEKMLTSNKIGKAIIAVYKSNPSTKEDLRRAEEIANGVIRRAEVFTNGTRELAVKTQIRMLEFWPNLQNNYSKLYKVITANNTTLAIPHDLGEFSSKMKFSDNLSSLDLSLVVLPVSKVSEIEFRDIIQAEIPNWIIGETKLHNALRLAHKWHNGEKRRSGINHYEGHVLPLTLAYFLNIFARGEDISQEDLISILLHDSVEDAESIEESNKRKRIIHREFGTKVLESVLIQTKQTNHSHETSEELDANQSEKLGINNINIEIIKKSIDRSGSHIGDLTVGVTRGQIKASFVKYYLNSKKHYSKLFESNPISRAIWIATEELFEAVVSNMDIS